MNSSRRRYAVLAGLGIFLAVGFQNCAQPKFTGSVLESSSVDIGDFTLKTKVLQVDNISKIDVLVVIDNSGSMATEQASMGSRFSSLISKLSGLDWRVAITTTDMQCASNKALCDGQLIQMKGLNGRYYLDSSLDSVGTAQSVFSDTVQRTNDSASAYEQGIGATYRSVQRSLASTDANAGFYRKDAALAVVVVSDADETGMNNDASKLTAMNVPENLVSLVSNTWGGKPFIFNAIVVKSNDYSCLKLAGSGNEGYGATYERLVKATGGIVGSVCESDYSNQLSSIGSGLQKVVRSISLDCEPVDSNSDGKLDLVVKVGSSAVSNYALSGSLITFDAALPAGSFVSVSYTCLKQ